MSTTESVVRPEAYSVAAFSAAFNVPKTTVYDLLHAGKLRAVRTGRRILIPREAVDEWLTSLDRVGEAG